MDVTEQRNGLAQALSAHDPAAVRDFLHPSYVVRGTDGVVVLDYRELMRELPTFFDRNPEYKQSVQVEASRTEGDTAMLTTLHQEVLRTLRRTHNVSSRWDETWKRIGDEWVLVEERPHVG